MNCHLQKLAKEWVLCNSSLAPNIIKTNKVTHIKNMHPKETQERKNVKGFRVFLQETLHIDKKNSQNTKRLEP